MARIVGKTEDGHDIYGTDFSIEVKECKQAADGKRTVSMIGSTPSVDRDGDTINQKGWDLKAFRKNPVILWGHNHSIPAIARANKFKKNAEALTFDEIEFPKEGVHPFADMIYSLMEAKFIRAGSVGFLPTEMEQRERAEGEPKIGWCPTNFKKQELLEFTICNVGCNRDALQTHLSDKGFKSAGKVKIQDAEYEVKDLLDALFYEPPAEDVIIDDDTKDGDTGNNGPLVTGDGTDRSHLKGEVVDLEDKTVIPHKKYPLADEDTVWNGPAQIREAGVDALRMICTWFDGTDSDVKSSYKLPHHMADDKKTVWRGVRAAMGALLGARGGVDIPEDERKGVYNHLEKHYVEFDKDVPEFKDYTAEELKEIFGDDVEEKETMEELEPVEIKSLKQLTDYLEESGIEDPEQMLLVGKDIITALKAGAVLSKANKTKLQNAAKAINDVLAAAEPAVTDGGNADDDKQSSPEVTAAIAGIMAKLAELSTTVDKLVDKQEVPPVEPAKEVPDQEDVVVDLEVKDNNDGTEEKEVIDFSSIDLSSEDGDAELELKGIDADELKAALNLAVANSVSKELNRVLGKVE